MNEKEILVVLSEYSDGPFDLATVFNIAFNLGIAEGLTKALNTMNGVDTDGKND